MILKIFSVRDMKADLYGRPFFDQSIGNAIRSFGDQVNANQPDNILFLHPEDFELYYLGEFDDNTGEITLKKREQIAVASNMVRKAN